MKEAAMIARDNYTKEHIQMLYRESGSDSTLLERVLFAFGLLEAISRVGLPFIFKGGPAFCCFWKSRCGYLPM
jgi:hypothetical protein